MRYNVAPFERLPMTALLTDKVFWPSHAVEMSGLYRVSHEDDHAPADEGFASWRKLRRTLGRAWNSRHIKRLTRTYGRSL